MEPKAFAGHVQGAHVRAETALKSLRQQRVDMALQIDEQQARHEAEARVQRANLRQEIRSIEQDFREKEAELQRKLYELQKTRDEEIARVKARDDDLHQRFEDAVDALRSQEHDLDDEIQKFEDYIRNLRSLYSNTTTSQVELAQASNKLEDAANSDVRSDTAESAYPTAINQALRREKQADPRRESVSARSIHENFPLVVCYQRRWYEIACYVCSANRPKNTTRFFRGWQGLRRHIKEAHSREYEAKTSEELLVACVQRRFQRSDVDLMRAGKQPVGGEPIELIRADTVDDSTESSRSKQKDSRGDVSEHDNDDEEEEDEQVNIPTRRRRSAASSRDNEGQYEELDDSANSAMDRSLQRYGRGKRCHNWRVSGYHEASAIKGAISKSSSDA